MVGEGALKKASSLEIQKEEESETDDNEEPPQLTAHERNALID